MRRVSFWIIGLLLVALPGCSGQAGAPSLAKAQRIAVISAFPPEAELLKAAMVGSRAEVINGVVFTSGRLAGQEVVQVLSGISMVNAAMTTQLLLDRYRVSSILVSGIAGGVDPALMIGDVVVPSRWGQYLEAVFAREVPGEEGVEYRLPAGTDAPFPNYGMIFPQTVEVRRKGAAEGTAKFWFDADPAMLAVAGELAEGIELRRCTAEEDCLDAAPAVVIGGNGVSGQAFVDNAAFRRYTHKTFQAQVLDMETAAIATVAYANAVPFLAFRSLSDLAGGGAGENEIDTFFTLAAENSAAVVIAFLAAWKPPQ